MLPIILLLVVFICLFYFSISFYLKYKERRLILQVTGFHRGTESERKLVYTLLKFGFSPKVIFHDLFVPQFRDQYSQVDLVVATKVGLLVFEVKDFTGWLYGTGYKPQWIKILPDSEVKYNFYNPIMQNAQHIRDLKKQSPQFRELPYFSIIVFYGDCELKNITHVPENTYLVKANRVEEVINLILYENPPAAYTNKKEVVRILKSGVNNGENEEILQEHIHNLNEKLGEERIFR